MSLLSLEWTFEVGMCVVERSRARKRERLTDAEEL